MAHLFEYDEFDEHGKAEFAPAPDFSLFRSWKLLIIAAAVAATGLLWSYLWPLLAS